MELNNSIGVTSPGDMGQGVALCLKEMGFNVCMASDGRSARTRSLGEKAGLTDCGSLEKLVQTCDMVLSILDPGAAVTNARAVAAACKATGRKVVFVDCNAVAPQTMHEITDIMSAAGCTTIDAGIIGPPPRKGAKQRFYVSGPNAGIMNRINSPQINVRIAGDKIGDASAVSELFDRHRTRLCRMVSVRMDTRVTARFDPSDVVQEALAEAARKLPDLSFPQFRHFNTRECFFHGIAVLLLGGARFLDGVLDLFLCLDQLFGLAHGQGLVDEEDNVDVGVPLFLGLEPGRP